MCLISPTPSPPRAFASPHPIVYPLSSTEYAMKAATGGGNTAVAVRGRDSVAFITQRKATDRLVDPKSLTSIFRITDTGVQMSCHRCGAASQFACPPAA